MARPETLIPGNCYFSVHFYDNDLVLLIRVPKEVLQRQDSLIVLPGEVR